MDENELGDSDENALVKLASLLVLGAGLIALFLGYGWFWIVFAVGFAVFVPLVKLATDELGVGGVPDGSTADSRREPQRDRLGTDAPESKQDALDTLRTRYARGELSEDEFERKVERLLETETLEGAREHVAQGTESREHAARGAESGERDAGMRGRGEEARDHGEQARDHGKEARDHDEQVRDRDEQARDRDRATER